MGFINKNQIFEYFIHYLQELTLIPFPQIQVVLNNHYLMNFINKIYHL